MASVEVLRCNSCQEDILPHERGAHYKSDFHRYNVKRRCVEMPPVSRQLFEQKFSSTFISNKDVDLHSKAKQKKRDHSNDLQHDNNNNNNNEIIYNDNNNNIKKPTHLLKYYCKLCHRVFKTKQHMENHLQTKKHAIRLIKNQRNLLNKENELENDGLQTKQNENDENQQNNAKISNEKPNENSNINKLNDNQIQSSSQSQSSSQMLQQNGNNKSKVGSPPPLPPIIENCQNKNSNVILHSTIQQVIRMQTLKNIKDNEFVQIQTVNDASPRKQKSSSLSHLSDSNKYESGETYHSLKNLNQIEGSHLNSNINNEDATSMTSSLSNSVLLSREPIPIGDCLFCLKKFETLESGLDHMIKSHGFFVPFKNKLLSLEGILNKAGTIIGKYHQCIYCWRLFKSLKSVQQHMRHFYHCKIQLDFGPRLNMYDVENNNIIENENEKEYDDDKDDKDDDNDDDDDDDNDDDNVDDNDDNDDDNDDNDHNVNDDNNSFDNKEDVDDHKKEENNTQEGNISISEQSPFAEYYDFSKKYSNEQSLLPFDENENKKKIVDINDNDEIILNDGTIIGHRNLHLIYQQRYTKHETQTEEQLISQIHNPNKKFILQQMIKDKNKKDFEQSGMKEGNILLKQSKDDSFINLMTRKHKFSLSNFKNQNRMLY